MANEFSWEGFRHRFADELARLFKQEGHGYGQVEFAARVTKITGVTMKQPRVSTLLRGKNDPSLKEVEILAKGLGVDPGWLAFGTGKPNRDTSAYPKTPIEGEGELALPAQDGKTRRRRTGGA